MSTLFDAPPAAVPMSAPLNPSAPSQGRAELETHDRFALARRLAERFALIAFGLYHVPLFLNDYPSLGGGGFDDKGLALKWGHVFTPPGMWVARHVFHMTGAMPGAYQGDNGDVGEEFGRLLLAVAIGLVGAIVWTIADRRRPRARWVSETLHLLLRYSIVLGLASYGIAKLFPTQFPPIGAMELEQRVGQLTPMGLLWAFMEYSRPYAFFGGVMEMTAVVLLCVRRTATLGAIVCLAVMANVAALNYAYDVPVKLYATMIVVSAAVLLLYDAPRLLGVFVRDVAAGPSRLSSALRDRIPGAARWSIKIAVVGSVVVSSVVAMRSATGTAPPSALDGAWTVTSFTRDGQANETIGDSLRWHGVVVENNRVMIQLASNGRIGCGRTPSPDASAITLGCANSHRGDLRWTRDGNVLQLEGTFDGARVAASARHVERSDYQLFRRAFRWIIDR